MNIDISGGKEWKKILVNIQRQGLSLRVGILENGNTPSKTSVAEYAFYNEVGTEKIPSRPFLRGSVKQNKNKWAKSIAAMLTKIHSDRNATKNALIKAGSIMVGNVQDYINHANNDFAPNAASTKRRKGVNKKPLVNKGDLLKSINYEVVKTVL